MSNTNKKFDTRFDEIRYELGFSRNEMGQLLNVGEKTIRNYESGDVLLPIKHALILSRKYGYSLDWIYKNSTSNTNTEIHPMKNESDFIYDIRDFISRSNNIIHITIPDYHMSYIKKRNEILSSVNIAQAKENMIKELDASYSKIDKNKCNYYHFLRL